MEKFGGDLKERPETGITRWLWWPPLVRGIFLLLLGTYAFARPELTIALFARIIAFLVLADGTLALVGGIFGDVPSQKSPLVRGVLEILAGGFVFAHPLFVSGMTATILLYMLAFAAIQHSPRLTWDTSG